MTTNSYGAPPYAGSNPHQARTVRWDLLLVVAIDLAIWGAIIAAGVGLYRIFS